MKISSLLILAAVALPFSLNHLQAADDYGIFKVSANLQVSKVDPHVEVADTIEKMMLNSNDVINLALGRPLGTKINPKTEVLAAAVTFENDAKVPPGPPLSKLIVCDPSQDGVAQVVVTIATLSELVFQNAYEDRRNVGFGYGTGNILKTTKGDPDKNGFLASEFHAAGAGGGVHLDQPHGGKNANPSGTGVMQGPLKFVTTDKKGTTVTFDGIITRGNFSLSGKLIGTYTE